MKTRPYIPEKDFDILKNWITDERTHALWCAYRASYPLTRKSFDELLEKEKIYNNTAYIAESDEGEPVGFYCISRNTEKKESMLKFVVTAPEIRGKGFGTKMISLVINSESDSDIIRLCVFDCNTSALKCYNKAGFKEISHDENAFRYKDESWGRISMELKTK